MTLSERGALLRQDRLRLGLSFYRLAVLARVHPNSVMLAERGASSEAMLARIAAALRARLAQEPKA